MKFSTEEGKLAFQHLTDEDKKYYHPKTKDESFIHPPEGGEYFYAEARNPKQKGSSSIKSHLLADGQLAFTVETENFSKHRGPIAGKELFDQMMTYHGSAVKEIKAEWVYGTNQKIFEEEAEKEQDKFILKHHRDPERDELEEIFLTAAKKTWTAKQAARYGYARIKSFVRKHHEIHVVFTKP